MFIRLYPGSPPDVTEPPGYAFPQWGERSYRTDDAGEGYFPINTLAKRLPDDLAGLFAKLGLAKVTIAHNGKSEPMAEGVYDYPDQGRYATVEHSHDGKWFLELEAISFEDATAFYNELRQGTIKPTTPWRVKRTFWERFTNRFFGSGDELFIDISPHGANKAVMITVVRTEGLEGKEAKEKHRTALKESAERGLATESH
jgi:hypothetical protein